MHDERGIITKKTAVVNKTGRHLWHKIQDHRDELEFFKFDPQPGATTLVVSYGITARSMIEAARNARTAGKSVSTLVIHSLWPVPEKALRAALQGVSRVVVAELNLGQYRLEIERIAATCEPRPQVVGINRIDGDLISPQEIEKEF
jgi:2-oxoglutarate ferredoxin oxidoreductase subunit alpha